MDKALNIINAERNEYIEYLMVIMGYSKEDAEAMAKVMGY